MDRCDLLLTFSVYRGPRVHIFITAEVSATGRRLFMDDMTGRFGVGTMHAVFQVVGTVFVEKRALNAKKKKNVSKLFSSCLKYSWCNVIWASGFVGIHMLKRAPNLVLDWIEPLKVILLSRRSIQNMNLPMFLLLLFLLFLFFVFFAKNRDSQNDWRIDSSIKWGCTEI